MNWKEINKKYPKANWASIKGYEHLYAVSTNGQVYSSRSDKILSPGKTTNGYSFVGLSKNGQVKNYRIHRLVAESFVENPLNKPEINHKNSNRVDNRVENLEWCDRSENLRHCVRERNIILYNKHI